VNRNDTEPPECSATSTSFLVGQDSRGHWVVQDERGLCGGLFVDRGNAIRFAMDETGNRPQAIKMVPGILELDMRRLAGPAPTQSIDHDRARGHQRF